MFGEILAAPGRPRLRWWSKAAVTTAMALLMSITVSVTHPPSASAEVGVPVTYQGPTYGSDVASPTADKPQSKIWYTDGSWWGLLTAPGGNQVRIHQLMPDHAWRDTGTAVDDRVNSTGDALWSGGKLWVASRHASTPLRINRFSYSAATKSWSVDPGFPVTAPTGGGSESATIDRDTTGRLWVTYTRGSRVWLTTSGDDGASWASPVAPAVSDSAVTADDISTLVAFQGKIGVLWSDQGDDTFKFAIHRDGAPLTEWTSEVALSGPALADDHVNLKNIDSDAQGRIFAAIKTSTDDVGPSDAVNVGVLVRRPGVTATDPGTWSLVPAGTVADDFTRPIIALDETNQELYFLGTAPEAGGVIYYKKTSLANPSFGPGRGTPFVSSPGRTLNNASGSKQPVNAQTGLVVLAAAGAIRTYFHGEMQLGGSTPPPDTTAPTAPTALAATANGPREVALTWTASTDNVGIAGYEVRRDGTAVGTVATPGYTDTSVVPATTFRYTVVAKDAAGNVSAPSAEVSVTTPPVATAGIAFRAATSAANAEETTVTVPVPAASAGDVMLAAVDVRGAPTITAPAGWQLVRLTANGSTMRTATYWHVAGTTEPASYTWQFSVARSAVGSIQAYSGVSVSNPIDVSAGQVNGTLRTVTAPSITTTVAGAMVVGTFSVATAATYTAPTGMTERTDRSVATTLTSRVSEETADFVQAEPGATGARVATASASAPGVGQLIALRPAQSTAAG